MTLHRTLSQFKDLGADVGINFVLAQTDPNGNPTNGSPSSSSLFNFANKESQELKLQCRFLEKVSFKTFHRFYWTHNIHR